MQFFVFVVVVLLIILAGFFVYHYFFSDKTKDYLVKNKYYSFELQTPKNWIALGKTTYSDDDIAQLLAQCKNDKSNTSSAYEIGGFRFEDQRYPDDFVGLGVVNSDHFPTGLSSGAVLEIRINCIPDSVKNQWAIPMLSDLKVAGEKAFEDFLNSPEFGKAGHIFFYHNNFQYMVSQYVYISPGDKGNENKLRQNYAATFNKIISSFEFK